MGLLNKVFLLGHLTRDPELRQHAPGDSRCRARLAVNRTWVEENGKKQEESIFLEVTVWGKTAEIAQRYLQKGSPLSVEVRLQLDSWQDRQTGQRRSRLHVVGKNLQLIGSRPSASSEPSSPARPVPSEPDPDWIRYKKALKTLLPVSGIIVALSLLTLGLHAVWNFLAHEGRPVIFSTAGVDPEPGTPEPGTPATAWRLEPGHWFSIVNLEGKQILTKWMGWVPTVANLPQEGNSIGDCYGINGGTHCWIWLIPAGATTPTWIDP